MLRAQGNLAAALDNYKAAQTIRERLAATDPGNTGWQSDLSVSHIKASATCFGLRAISRPRSTTIRPRTRSESASPQPIPANTGWQSDLSVSHNRIGDVLRTQGNLAAALDSYKAAQAIRERLAATDPANAGWQSNLAVSDSTWAVCFRAQGNLAAALDSYKAAQAIRERLAATDPGKCWLAEQPRRLPHQHR